MFIGLFVLGATLIGPISFIQAVFAEGTECRPQRAIRTFSPAGCFVGYHPGVSGDRRWAPRPQRSLFFGCSDPVADAGSRQGSGLIVGGETVDPWAE